MADFGQFFAIVTIYIHNIDLLWKFKKKLKKVDLTPLGGGGLIWLILVEPNKVKIGPYVGCLNKCIHMTKTIMIPISPSVRNFTTEFLPMHAMMGILPTISKNGKTLERGVPKRKLTYDKKKF